jgi:D-threo-aldose 1-dehydrogenase
VTELPRKTLGKTGVQVTTIGVGTAWIGLSTPMAGTTDRHLDQELAVRTIQAALENGVRLIDTAALYLNSESERLVARALRERPDLAGGVVVETKCCRLPDGSDYSYDGAMRSVEGSLERLGTRRIELLYIHDPPKEALPRVTGKGGALEALRKLQADGVVGHVGIASNYPEDNAPFVETGEFEMAVVPDAYSLLNQVALERIFPAAERFGMGVVVATPLERGLLALGAKGAREGNAQFYARVFSDEVLAQVERMEAVCARHGVSLLAAALQYVTRHPVVATTIPGPRSPEEARQNALAARATIPETLWADLEPLVRNWDIVAPRPG